MIDLAPLEVPENYNLSVYIHHHYSSIYFPPRAFNDKLQARNNSNRTTVKGCQRSRMAQWTGACDNIIVTQY